jgi:hypothetical protein
MSCSACLVSHLNTDAHSGTEILDRLDGVCCLERRIYLQTRVSTVNPDLVTEKDVTRVVLGFRQEPSYSIF